MSTFFIAYIYYFMMSHLSQKILLNSSYISKYKPCFLFVYSGVYIVLYLSHVKLFLSDFLKFIQVSINVFFFFFLIH